MARVGLPVDQLADEALLAGYGQCDPELAVAFVRRFQARVFGVALAVCGDRQAAEDVAQLAFERAWRHAPAYDARRATVGGWLGVITRHLAIDAVRLRRPAPLDAAELLARTVDAGRAVTGLGGGGGGSGGGRGGRGSSGGVGGGSGGGGGGSGGGSDPESAAISGDAAADLRAALRRLRPEQATAVVLAGIVGLSASEVAEREGIPLGTAKTRIRTAMQHLRADLEHRGTDRA
ncbi:MAG: RNA polymerase sigma factor [Acidimicrobiales bacterium]